MRTVGLSPVDVATEIDRHSCREATDLSPRRKTKFAKCAEIIWPGKPSAEIASIMHADIRTAQRVLAGKAEIPWCVLRAALDEFVKPD